MAEVDERMSAVGDAFGLIERGLRKASGGVQGCR